LIANEKAVILLTEQGYIGCQSIPLRRKVMRLEEGCPCEEDDGISLPAVTMTVFFVL